MLNFSKELFLMNITLSLFYFGCFLLLCSPIKCQFRYLTIILMYSCLSYCNIGGVHNMQVTILGLVQIKMFFFLTYCVITQVWINDRVRNVYFDSLCAEYEILVNI